MPSADGVIIGPPLDHDSDSEMPCCYTWEVGPMSERTSC